MSEGDQEFCKVPEKVTAGAGPTNQSQKPSRLPAQDTLPGGLDGDILGCRERVRGRSPPRNLRGTVEERLPGQGTRGRGRDGLPSEEETAAGTVD